MPAISRRLAIGGACASALGVTPAHASDFQFDPTGSWIREVPDSTWAKHEGPFTEEFFKDFKTTDTGFAYKFLQQGEGDKPIKGQAVLVHYTGYLPSGKKFDSSYDREQPFKFTLGSGKVIPGWEAIVSGMNKGKRVVVKIPPQYAYGDKGAGNKIPPNSDLIFYMELYRLFPVESAD
uniref:peptidylprolyl isomerase n=1 Tax=Haptolina brevifila TaxID=156173 RepID=A0A7S2JUG0_9EUKA